MNRVIDEDGHVLKSVVDIYRWETDDAKDYGHGYHIASMSLDEIPHVLFQLELIKQKLLRDCE